MAPPLQLMFDHIKMILRFPLARCHSVEKLDCIWKCWIFICSTYFAFFSPSHNIWVWGL